MAAHPPTDTVARMIAAGLVPAYESPVIGDSVLILTPGFERESDGEPETGTLTGIEPDERRGQPLRVRIDGELPGEVVEFMFAATELALICPAESTPAAERPPGAPGTPNGPVARSEEQLPSVAWHPELAALMLAADQTSRTDHAGGGPA